MHRFKWGRVMLAININSEKKNEAEVKAFIYGTSGLAITQYYHSESRGAFNQITHVPTGLSIGRKFNFTHKEAKVFIQALASLLDWNGIESNDETVKRLRPLIDMCKKVAKEGNRWLESLAELRLDYIRSRLQGV